MQRTAQEEKMNNDTMVYPKFEIKKEKKKDLNTLLKLSELRKKQVQAGEKIKELREELLGERENLKQVSSQIYSLLDDIK
jgi:hypothetical protein